MDLSIERRVIHNPILGALSLWSFCREYADFGGREPGPSLPSMMLVLPVVLHKESMASIRRMYKKSSLLKAVSEHPELSVNLQERLEWFADLAFSSLLMACSARLLSVDRDGEWPRYVATRKNLPDELSPVADDVKGILSASRRLGAWFSQVDFSVTCRLLRVQF
jgi:hypothetical protein